MIISITKPKYSFKIKINQYMILKGINNTNNFT